MCLLAKVIRISHAKNKSLK